MQLEESDTKLETLGKVVSQEVKISDAAMIIEHMVTTIYKNKKRIVVQEIISNARDAHREIGTPDRPIHVKLPNKFDSSLIIRDFGIGISPARMQDIFINVGNSTKRGDDLQTGGFGIGSKTPWSYTDVFTVRTITREDGKLVMRSYALVHGKASFSAQEMGDPITINVDDPATAEDDKHTGTSIIIDIANKEDWSFFRDYLVDVTRFWTVKPVVTGMECEWPEYKAVYEGEDWKIVSINSHYHRADTQSVCVDGIPYPVNLTAMENMPGLLHGLSRCGLILFFKVGQLAVALNREDLQYNDKTKSAIMAKMEEIYKTLSAKLEAEITGATNLWQANVMWQKVKETFHNTLIQSVKWQGIEVTGHHMNVHEIGEVRVFSKSHGTYGPRLKSTRQRHFNFSEDSILVINDCDSTSPLKLWTLFNGNASLKSVQLLTIADPTNADTVKWMTDNHLDKCGSINFSTVPKMVRAKAVAGAVVPNVGKAYVYNGRREVKIWTDYPTVDFKNGTGIYVTTERGYATDFDHNLIQKAVRTLGLKNEELYGIPARFSGSLGAGWRKLADVVKAAFDAEKAAIQFDYTLTATAEKYENLRLERNHHTIYECLKNQGFLALITDQDNPLVKWYNASEEIDKLIAAAQAQKAAINLDKLNGLAFLMGAEIKQQEATPHPEWDNLPGETEKALPLLGLFERMYVRQLVEVKEDFALWINARHQENLKKVPLTLEAVAV